MHIETTSFFHSVLHWSAAVSTICRHSCRVVAFRQAVARLKFRGSRSASIAPSQVWLSLPIGRFQSGCTCQRAPARARRWSSRGEPNWVNCEQYDRTAADVYWSPGEKAVNNQWFFWLPHLTCGEYMVSSRSCIVPTCQMHQDESGTGTLSWPRSHTHTSKHLVKKMSKSPFIRSIIIIIYYTHKPQCNSNKLGQRESIAGRCWKNRSKYESEECRCWQQYIRQTRLHVTHSNLIWQITDEQLHIQNAKQTLISY